jgi:hypothetical protein
MLAAGRALAVRFVLAAGLASLAAVETAVAAANGPQAAGTLDI